MWGVYPQSKKKKPPKEKKKKKMRHFFYFGLGIFLLFGVDMGITKFRTSWAKDHEYLTQIFLYPKNVHKFYTNSIKTKSYSWFDYSMSIIHIGLITGFGFLDEKITRVNGEAEKVYDVSNLIFLGLAFLVPLVCLFFTFVILLFKQSWDERPNCILWFGRTGRRIEFFMMNNPWKPFLEIFEFCFIAYGVSNDITMGMVLAYIYVWGAFSFSIISSCVFFNVYKNKNSFPFKGNAIVNTGETLMYTYIETMVISRVKHSYILDYVLIDGKYVFVYDIAFVSGTQGNSQSSSSSSNP